MALFQQGEGVDPSDDGGGVISSPHPGLVLLRIVETLKFDSSLLLLTLEHDGIKVTISKS